MTRAAVGDHLGSLLVLERHSRRWLLLLIAGAALLAGGLRGRCRAESRPRPTNAQARCRRGSQPPASCRGERRRRASASSEGITEYLAR